MTGRPDLDDLLTEAGRAHALVQADAWQAAELAQRTVARARSHGHREAHVAALHALGFARHELGDPRAIPTLRSAVRLAERSGLHNRAALVRRPLAIYLAMAGRTRQAVYEMETACAALDELELARAEASRIAVLQQAGRPPELARSERALDVLRRAGDAIWEARLLKNRGVMHTQRHEFDAAERDLVRARDLYSTVGATTAAVVAGFQLARISLARGDIPQCLESLDSIDAQRIPLFHYAELELLRARALVSARLTREARSALGISQNLWRQAGFDDPEGRVDAVTLTLLSGDPVGAVALGRRTYRVLAARGRASYAAEVAGRTLEAAILAGSLTPSSLRSGRRAVAALEEQKMHGEALRVRLVVARAAIELGSRRVARRELDACAALRRRGLTADRVERWHVEALVRRAEGDVAGAQRALLSGLRLVDVHRATLGASDLRATASELGVGLARLGLRIALDRGDTEAMLRWSERLRANALRLTPVTRTGDTELRELHVELRRSAEQIRRAEREGLLTQEQVDRRASIEASIRRLSRHAAGDTVIAGGSLRRHALSRALGSTALVELIELDGSLLAITLADGRLTRHELGELAPVGERLDWLLFALNRLSRVGHDPAEQAAAVAAVESSADALGELLLAPLAEVIGDRPLLIVPTGPLHAVPWSILPSLRGRPVVVAPSASTWLSRQSPAAADGRGTVLVAGPRLPNAQREVRTVAELYPGATTLAGRGATVAAVLDALDGAKIAHIACHGQFRSDSPLFSALELADGQLSAYELERLRRPPELVVLAACDLAIPEARPGDELLGFAAALLGTGTRTIIASVVPVGDAPTKRLMTELHRRLVAGDSPGVALAAAQARLRPRESALGGFVCIGAS